MQKTTLAALNEMRQSRRAVIVLSVIADESSRLILEGEDGGPEFAKEVDAAFLSGKSRLITLLGREYFLNVYLPPTRLVVIGAVHISQVLAGIAADTGFDLEIIDPRTAFASVQRFENTRLFADWPQDVLAAHPLDAFCALIAVTHDPKIDDFALQAALEANCFYVGALGSRKTHAKRLERLSVQGLSDKQLANIHAPIGMDIGAANPAEIAVAILAQVIEAFRRRSVAE